METKLILCTQVLILVFSNNVFAVDRDPNPNSECTSEIGNPVPAVPQTLVDTIGSISDSLKPTTTHVVCYSKTPGKLWTSKHWNWGIDEHGRYLKIKGKWVKKGRLSYTFVAYESPERIQERCEKTMDYYWPGSKGVTVLAANSALGRGYEIQFDPTQAESITPPSEDWLSGKKAASMRSLIASTRGVMSGCNKQIAVLSSTITLVSPALSCYRKYISAAQCITSWEKGYLASSINSIGGAFGYDDVTHGLLGAAACGGNLADTLRTCSYTVGKMQEADFSAAFVGLGAIALGKDPGPQTRGCFTNLKKFGSDLSSFAGY